MLYVIEILFDYNFGKGFTIGGVNALQQKHEIKRNINFDLPF